MTKTPYKWQPIQEGNTRLVTLLPARHDDPIKIKIESVRLEPPVTPEPSRRLPLSELEQTLPEGWIAAETHQYQYRVLFEDLDEETHWEHPNPGVDPTLWAPFPEMPPANYEPTFEALSYVCGPTTPQDPSVEIIVAEDKEHSPESKIRVGCNLAVALQHLRYEDKPRRLWIDAISIDQQNAPERANQVRHISQVYRWAWRVIIWLGPATKSSRCAISTLAHIGNQLEISSDHIRYRSPQATERDWFRSTCTPDFPKPTWSAIEELFQREWWERLWVWQESQLANSRATVICGFDQMEWQCLRKAIICLRTKDELPISNPGLRKRLELVEMMTIERSRCSLALVLNSSRIRKCLDPRDKIYGILSIAGDVLSRSIKPDYSEGKTAADVYREVFKTYTLQTNQLELLASCEHSSGDQSSFLPSWVPDINVARRTESLLPFQLVSGVSGADAIFGEGTLQASGLTADSIAQLYEPIPLDSEEVFQALRNIYLAFEAGDDDVTALMRVIRAGYFDESWTAKYAAPPFAVWKSQFQDAVRSRRKPDESEFYWCLRLVRGRRLFRTAGGRMGLGPLEALEGMFEAECNHDRAPLILCR